MDTSEEVLSGKVTLFDPIYQDNPGWLDGPAIPPFTVPSSLPALRRHARQAGAFHPFPP